jgi:hypothetical protein
MNFKQQIAKYVTGNLTTSQLPNIGVEGLQEGLDTPSLLILAGLSKNENLHEIDQYFKKTLGELKLELPGKRQAAFEYALGIVDEVIEGKKNIIDGTREIIWKALSSYDFNSADKEYVYDSISISKVYGLYYEYDDLTNGLVKQLPSDKTDEQLQAEVKEQLLNELKIWKDKIESGEKASTVNKN